MRRINTADTSSFTSLGTSGLKVSKIILGCMSYGDRRWAPWVKNREESLPLLKAAFDAGVNTWDTANMYSNGVSEEIIGEAIKKYEIPRSQIVIMTKAFFPVAEDQVGTFNGGPEIRKDPRYINRCGLSRGALFEQVDASLKRMQIDYIDVLQIHRIDDTPFIEVMKALNDLVESGKVRYIGASSMWAHELAQMQAIAEMRGWAKFISMQNEHNLIYREEEREMIRYCKKTGVGLVPWGPLAAGALCRPLSQLNSTDRGQRNQDKVQSEADAEIINHVDELAKKKGWTMAQVAFAWSATVTTAPILGLSSEDRLKEFVAAVDYELTLEERKYLEEPYKPKPVQSFNQDRTTS
jgi:aryl-alcohol dehydrogenase-like predicted oxidoreductase